MAAIAQSFVKQETKQVHTGDLLWTDISGVSLADTEFVNGQKYLIVCTARIGGRQVTRNFGFRLLHGSTAFAGATPQNDDLTAVIIKRV